MMSHRGNNKKLLRDYLVAEKNERERLTERYVDDNYQWEGGFD